MRPRHHQKNEANLAASEQATNFARAETLGLGAFADVTRDTEGVTRLVLTGADNQTEGSPAQ